MLKQAIKSFRPNGVIMDVPASELPDEVYTYAENFIFQDGSAMAAAGYSPMVDALLFTPQGIASVRTPAVYYWLYAGDNGVGVTDGTNHFDITPVGITLGGVGDWTMANVNNLPLICGGHQGVPFYWDQQTANVCQPLPGFPADTTVGFIRTFKGFAIVGDVKSVGDDFENQLLWSDPVGPGEVPSKWTPTPDNLAGDNVLASTEGALIDGIALRDQFLLFKTHSTYSMRLSGGVGVFTFQKLFTSIGLLSRNCAVEYKALCYMFTDGDIVVTDGHSVESIADRKVRSVVFNEMDADNFNACFAEIWRDEDEILFAYPTSGSVLCDRAAIYNTKEKVWGFRELPTVAHAHNGLLIGDFETFTWDTLPYAQWTDWGGKWNDSNVKATSDSLIMADPDGVSGNLLGLGVLAAVNPEVHTNILEKVTMDLDQPTVVKTVNELWIFINDVEPNTAFEVRLGTQMQKWEAVSWQSFVTFDPNMQDKLDVFAVGRFISIQIRTHETGSRRMRLNGFDIRYRFGGRF